MLQPRAHLYSSGTTPPKPHVSYGSAVSYVSSVMAWRDDLRALRHRLGRAHARGGQSLGVARGGTCCPVRWRPWARGARLGSRRLPAAHHTSRTASAGAGAPRDRTDGGGV